MIIYLFIPDGNIGLRAFDSCTNLTTIHINSNVQFYDDPFYNCPKLTYVINNASLEFNMRLLSEKIKTKVISNLLYEKVMLIQRNLYLLSIMEPKLSELYYLYNHLGLIEDVLPIITIFEGQEGSFSQLLQGRFNKIILSDLNNNIDDYEVEARKVALEVKQQHILYCHFMPLTLKLNQYLKQLDKIIKEKKHRQPSFFSKNKCIYVDIRQKHRAVNKLISYLQHNKKTEFNHEEIKTLSNGFIGKLILSFNLDLSHMLVIHDDSSITAPAL